MKNLVKNVVLITFFMSFIPVSYAQDDVEEVVVTANKKAQTAQEIPMNISVITEQSMLERGMAKPEDFLRTLAGVSTPGGDVYYTIRGLNTSTAQTSSGTTSTFIDEVGGSSMHLFDLARIEVLRGPQGTLYGSNAVGGTIRYITNKPNPDEMEAAFSFELGSKSKSDVSIKSLNAMINLPITDNTAVRATFSSSEDPGIYQNIATERKDIGKQEDDSFRITLLHEDGPLSVMARYGKAESDDFGQKEKGNADKPGSADIVNPACSYSAEWYYGDTCTRVFALAAGSNFSYDPDFAFYSFTDEQEQDETTVLTEVIKYDFGKFDAILIRADYDFETTAITDWSRIDTDDLYTDILYYNSSGSRDTTELRISSKPGDIEWTVGYYKERFDSDPGPTEVEPTDAGGFDYVTGYMGFTSHSGGYDPTLYPAPFNNPYLLYGSYNYYSYTEEKAFFGQVDFKWDNFVLTAGLRDFELSDGFKGSEYGIFYEGDLGCDGTSASGTTCSEENGSESDTRPKFTLSYIPDEDLTVFLVSSVGYRNGGNNAALPPFCANDPEAAGFSRRFKSDEAKNTEIGVKSRGDNYSLNATYFWVDWTGIQVTVRPACGWSFTYNGGEAETSGLELDFSYNLTSNLYLDFSGSFMSAEITNDIDSLGATAGDRLPNVAEQQYNVGLTYDFNVASNPAYARFDINHYGDSYATFAEDNEDMSPSYTKLNLNVGIQLESSYVQLSIDNLTDERTEAFRFSAESPGYRPRNYLQWIPPRSISVQYRYGF